MENFLFFVLWPDKKNKHNYKMEAFNNGRNCTNHQKHA